jgi:hypothetical protein
VPDHHLWGFGCHHRQGDDMNDKSSKDVSLCWHCSGEQGFYESPCPHCGRTNPNVDLNKALSEMERVDIGPVTT